MILKTGAHSGPARSSPYIIGFISLIGVIMTIVLMDHAINHLGLGIEIRMPTVYEKGSTPKLQGGLTDGGTVNSYILLTPEADIFSRDSRPLNCSEDLGPCNILDPKYQWWQREDMIEVRPTVVLVPSGHIRSGEYRWSERECATIAHESRVRTGWFNDPETATFVRVSNQGGCILRLP